MSFFYHDPNTVVNPKKVIEKITVLYDGKEDGFSLAVVVCEGLDHVAIRWNVAIKEQADEDKKTGKLVCAGSPAVNRVPAWFILPRELFNPVIFDKDSEGFLKMVEGWGGNNSLKTY